MKPKISKRLKELRAINKKTQGQIAEVLGISRQAYSRYESSTREPGLETLAKLAEYYDVSPQYFFVESLDKTADSEMDIVELSAIYQAQKVAISKHLEEVKTIEPVNSQKDIKSMKEILFNKLDYDIKLGDLSEEQLSKIKGEDGKTIKIAKPKKFAKIKITLFYILVLLVLINIGMMTIHKMDPTYEYSVFDYSYINAISPDQNVNQTMFTNIVKITEFNVDNTSVGDYVVIYSDFGIDEYWVESITSINEDTEEVSTTYDNVSIKTVSYDDVLGKYEKDANIFGTIFYSGKFTTGYLLILTGQGFALSFIYYSIFDRRRSRK